jgi:hypothetical protein
MSLLTGLRWLRTEISGRLLSACSKEIMNVVTVCDRYLVLKKNTPPWGLLVPVYRFPLSYCYSYSNYKFGSDNLQ